ncbi:hypothetical protein RFI_01713, partial [Reticulomyxa filosa]
KKKGSFSDSGERLWDSDFVPPRSPSLSGLDEPSVSGLSTDVIITHSVHNSKDQARNSKDQVRVRMHNLSATSELSLERNASTEVVITTTNNGSTAVDHRNPIFINNDSSYSPITNTNTNKNKNKNKILNNASFYDKSTSNSNNRQKEGENTGEGEVCSDSDNQDTGQNSKNHNTSQQLTVQ